MGLWTKIKNNRFFSDVAITTIGQIVVMLVAFALNKVVSNNLTVENFGVYNLIRRSVSVVSYVMLAAMGIAVPKFIAELVEKKDERGKATYGITSLLIVCFFCLIASIILAVFPNTVAEIVFGAKEYSVYVLPIILYSVTSTLFTYICSYYRGVGDFKKYNVFQIAMQVATLVIALIAGVNLYWIIVGWSIVYGVLDLVILINFTINESKQVKPFKLCEFKDSAKTLLKYGLPRIPGEFVLFAFSLLPLSVVLHKFGLTESAYFSCAISITTMITPLFSFVGIVLLPMASKSLVNKDIKTVTKSLKVLTVLYLAISLLAIGFIELLPEFVISVLFSGEYFDAIYIVRIVIISLLPNAIYLLLRNPIDGISKVPYNTIVLIISFAITVVAMYLSPDMITCSWAYVLGYVVLGVLSYIAWFIALLQVKRKN